MVEFTVNAGILAGEEGSVFDGIEAAADLGVGAVEFFDWESPSLKRVREVAKDSDVTVAGTLAAGAGSNIDDRDAPAATNPYDHDTAVADIERSLEGAAFLGADFLILTPGPDQGGFGHDTQRRAIERVLRAVAPTAEDVGVTLVVEPLNTVVDHPGYFLESSQVAFDLVRAVDSDRVQVLFDVYHQQITEGDVIRTLRENIDDVGHVHVADNPGRHEPGTGEIAYENVFATLDEIGYDGYVGIEFFEASEGTTIEAGITETLALD